MNDELPLHLRKLQTRATLSLIGILTIIISLVLGTASLLGSSYAAVPFFAVALIGTALLVYAKRASKSEEQGGGFEPVVFQAKQTLSFAEVNSFFESITDAKNQFAGSEDIRFFLTKYIFTVRAVVYQTVSFDKAAFDTAKDRINKKANQELNQSEWVSLSEARELMRFNIICAGELNDELYRLMCRNAEPLMRRAEGTIPIAIIGDRIMIPSIYGDCELTEIRRYKRVIRFIHEAFLQ